MTRSIRFRLAAVCLLALPVLAACSDSDSGGSKGNNMSAQDGTSAKDNTAGSGDSGSKGGDNKGDSGSKGGVGTIRYSGPENGDATFTNSVCSVRNGKLSEMTAPTSKVELNTRPQLSIMFGEGRTSLAFGASEKMLYTAFSASGVSVAKKNGKWTVTLTDSQIEANGPGDPITLNGTIACGHIEGS